MSSMFDAGRAQHDYENNPQYHAMVDALTSMFVTRTLSHREAFRAVEHACRKADDVALRRLEERYGTWKPERQP